LKLSHLFGKLAPAPLVAMASRIHFERAVRNAKVDEEPERLILRALVGPGDLVLDVGANVGVYTRFLSEWVGPTGRVIAIEPVPSTHTILRHVVRRLKLSNVETVQCAASDAAGTVEMVVPPFRTGLPNYYQARVTGSGNVAVTRSFHVNVATVDSLAMGRGAVAVVKCDVEGHELRCFRGARDLVRRSRPAWLIEISGDPDERGSDAEELLRSARDEGYRVYRQVGAHLRLRVPGDRTMNYFFLTDRHVQALGATVTA